MNKIGYIYNKPEGENFYFIKEIIIKDNELNFLEKEFFFRPDPKSQVDKDVFKKSLENNVVEFNVIDIDNDTNCMKDNCVENVKIINDNIEDYRYKIYFNKGVVIENTFNMEIKKFLEESELIKELENITFDNDDITIFKIIDNNYIDLMKAIIKKKINLNVKLGGITPLEYCIGKEFSKDQYKNEGIIIELIKNSSNINYLDIFDKCYIKKKYMVLEKLLAKIKIEDLRKFILDNKYILDNIFQYYKRNTNAKYVSNYIINIIGLITAAQEGYLDIVKRLLENGVNPNQKRKSDGATPLFIVTEIGNLDIVYTLLKNKADPNILTGDGKTPLAIAVEYNYLDIVALLLKNNANVNLVSVFTPGISGTSAYLSEKDGIYYGTPLSISSHMHLAESNGLVKPNFEERRKSINLLLLSRGGKLTDPHL